jgi:hypothetical protein
MLFISDLIALTPGCKISHPKFIYYFVVLKPVLYIVKLMLFSEFVSQYEYAVGHADHFWLIFICAKSIFYYDAF